VALLLDILIHLRIVTKRTRPNPEAGRSWSTSFYLYLSSVGQKKSIARRKAFLFSVVLETRAGASHVFVGSAFHDRNGNPAGELCRLAARACLVSLSSLARSMGIEK
jgi:hypothetical protein